MSTAERSANAASPPAPAPAAGRPQSLDAYRGLIMVSLAFNGFGPAATARNHFRADPDSGFWRGILHQVEHVEWFGCPFVNRIWTPSWALYSTGWCCLILAALYAVIDLRHWRAWSFPLVGLVFWLICWWMYRRKIFLRI